MRKAGLTSHLPMAGGNSPSLHQRPCDAKGFIARDPCHDEASSVTGMDFGHRERDKSTPRFFPRTATFLGCELGLFSLRVVVTCGGE
jgi:hypothetical protein